MIGLSSIIGKPVLSLETSGMIGKVADAYFDANCKKAVYYCVEQPLKNGTALLPVQNAQSVSDAIIISDENAVAKPDGADTAELICGLLDMPVYTLTGVLKGSLTDVQFTPAGKVSKLVCGDLEFTPPSVSSIGDVIFLKNAVKAAPNRKKRAPRIPRPEKDYPVYILDGSDVTQVNTSLPTDDGNFQANVPIIEPDASGEIPSSEATSSYERVTADEISSISSSTAATVATASAIAPTNIAAYATEAQPSPAVALSADNREPVLSNGAFKVILDGSEAYSYEEDSHTPTRVICDYEFLLGRTLGADLCTYTGELIATSGSAVSDIIVEKARRAGKLVELTLNSIKPDRKNRDKA